MHKTKITGTGSYIPKKKLTNHDLEKMVDTSHEWIVERTGIESRHIAEPQNGESNSEMAAEASKKALEMAGLEPNDIDLIIFATCSPDKTLPSSGALLQTLIGIDNECPTFDLAAACSGFVYGAVVADNFIKTGMYKNILVLGSEVLSAITNWEDRDTCILFSDGSGAAIFSRAEDGEDSEFMSSTLGCAGSGAPLLTADNGGSTTPLTKENLDDNKQYISMEGRKVFKYATRTMINNIKYLLEETGFDANEVDHYITHQANLRIIEYIAKKIGLQNGKAVVTVGKYGNNSAATVPIALDESIRSGRIKRGDTIILDAFGAGVTTGGVLLRF